MKVHQTDFSTGNVYRNIMEVALPMIMAQLLNLLYNVVDRMYIGRIPEVGTMALTGVGLCFPIITLINAFTLLYGNGGAPLCAMERGRGNDREAGMLMGNSFVLLVGTGVVLTVAGLIGYRPVLQLFGASEVTLPYAADYIRIYLMGTVFVMIAVGMNPFINSQGFGNVGMLSVLIGAVINMILDPILIFGFHMGVRGSCGHRVFPALLRSLGHGLSHRKESAPAAYGRDAEAVPSKGKEHCGSWSFRLYHVLYQQPCAGGLQYHPAALWRGYLCGGHDGFKLRKRDLHPAGTWLYQWSLARYEL